jgi:hypothetical protein
MRELLLALALATATGPTFTKASAGVNSNGFLVVNFTETGLPPGASITYTLATNRQATWACVAGSGKHATAISQQTLSDSVEVSAVKTAGNNGVVQSGMAVSPVGWNGLSCSTGSLTLVSVSYTNILLTDVTNGISTTPGGSCGGGCAVKLPGQ